MKKRENFLPAFLAFIFLCLVILAFSLSGGLKFLSSFLEQGTSGIQAISFDLVKNLPFSYDQKYRNLENKNLDLISRVADFEKLEKENEALSDQFKTSNPQSLSLLKTDVIGAPGFVPGISTPKYFILDKGSKDGVKKGQAVIIKDNLVGIISDVSENLSKADTINNSEISFTAKTEKDAVGVVKNERGSLTLDNVQLSSNIKPEQIVFTNGDIDSNGVGIPKDLVVGKVASVDKNPSDLFQKAKIESFVNFSDLSTVFVYLDIQ